MTWKWHRAGSREERGDRGGQEARRASVITTREDGRARGPGPSLQVTPEKTTHVQKTRFNPRSCLNARAGDPRGQRRQDSSGRCQLHTCAWPGTSPLTQQHAHSSTHVHTLAAAHTHTCARSQQHTLTCVHADLTDLTEQARPHVQGTPSYVAPPAGK